MKDILLRRDHKMEQRPMTLKKERKREEQERTEGQNRGKGKNHGEEAGEREADDSEGREPRASYTRITINMYRTVR